MSASIFISFAAQDRKVANTLCAALESRGFQCWISTRDILPGENFQSAIVRAIRKAKMMLLVFTGNSNSSEEMTKELALASQSKLIVVPLRVEDVTPNDAFAYEFATRQWIDFFADWEQAMNQLSERISSAFPPEVAAPAVLPKPAAKAPEPEVAVAPPPPEPEPPAPAPVPEPVVAKAMAAKDKAAAVALAEPPPAVEEVKPAPPPPARAPAPTPAPASEPFWQTLAPDVEPAEAGAHDSAAYADAPVAKKSRAGLFIGIGVVVVLLIGAAVAVPMLLKKPSGPETAVAATPAPAHVASTPAPVVAAPVAAPTVEVAPTTPAASPADPNAPLVGAAPIDGTGVPGAPPVAPPKPRVHKPVAPHVVHVAKPDVPY